jgi:hypothetical protein
MRRIDSNVQEEPANHPGRQFQPPRVGAMPEFREDGAATSTCVRWERTRRSLGNGVDGMKRLAETEPTTTNRRQGNYPAVLVPVHAVLPALWERAKV